MNPEKLAPKMKAGIDMVGRTGAAGFDIRYQDNMEPTVWIAVARYPQDVWEAAAGHDAEQAVLRLCEQLVDGGSCVHCGKLTAFDPDHRTTALLEASAAFTCWYRWDPELATFRRSCEGQTTAVHETNR